MVFPVCIFNTARPLRFPCVATRTSAAAVHTGAASPFNASMAAEMPSNPAPGTMLACLTSSGLQLAPP